MGEYFSWVNIDKKQFLTPVEFDYGSKFHESRNRGNDLLSAVYALLSDDWKGDHVLFLGDEGNPNLPQNYHVFQELNRQILQFEKGYYYYYFVEETYWNISGLFKAAEKELRPEIEETIGWLEKGIYEKESLCEFLYRYRVKVNNPFKNLFKKEGKTFKYIINHTKRVYYSFGMTTICYPDGTEDFYMDPLPMLMAYGRSADIGEWVGDVIGVADEIDDTYTLLKEIFLDW